MNNNNFMASRDAATVSIRALAADEVDLVAGGALFQSFSSLFANPLSTVALNPQPLPPRYRLTLSGIR